MRLFPNNAAAWVVATQTVLWLCFYLFSMSFPSSCWGIIPNQFGAGQFEFCSNKLLMLLNIKSLITCLSPCSYSTQDILLQLVWLPDPIPPWFTLIFSHLHSSQMDPLFLGTSYSPAPHTCSHPHHNHFSFLIGWKSSPGYLQTSSLANSALKLSPRSPQLIYLSSCTSFF